MLDVKDRLRILEVVVNPNSTDDSDIQITIETIAQALGLPSDEVRQTIAEFLRKLNATYAELQKVHSTTPIDPARHRTAKENFDAAQAEYDDALRRAGLSVAHKHPCEICGF